MTKVHLQLRKLAEDRQLNMNQVARQTGLTLTMVRRYWLNETSKVTLEAIGRLAELLKVQPGELFVFADDASEVKLSKISSGGMSQAQGVDLAKHED